jgi:hypothetical protein
MKKPKLPTLPHVIQDAHRNGTAVNRFSISPDEAAEIRRAEAQGGSLAGLKVVLVILRRRRTASAAL